jgi:hypothetical protein
VGADVGVIVSVDVTVGLGVKVFVRVRFFGLIGVFVEVCELAKLGVMNKNKSHKYIFGFITPYL